MSTDSIGVTARDYSTVEAWLADIPATLTEEEVGECYNDGEFVPASELTFSGFTSGSFTIHLTAAAGESFVDHADAATNPLKYDQSKGVGIRSNLGFDDTLLINNTNGIFKFTRLQLKKDDVGGTNFCIASISSGHAIQIENCISVYDDTAVANQLRGTESYAVNSTFICTNSSVSVGLQLVGTINVRNITVALSGSTASGTGINITSGTDHIAKNVAVFGFSTDYDATGWDTTNSSHNASDGTGNPGGNSQDSLTYADQFEDTGASTYDYRPVSTGSLDENATRDQTWTNDLDIVEQARSITIPTIGAFEVVNGISATTASLDAYIEAQGLTLTNSLDAYIQIVGLTEIASLDAYIQQVGLSSTAVVDALIQASLTKAASLDALVTSAGTLTLSLDAYIQDTKTLIASLDAVITSGGLSVFASLDALVQTSATLTNSLDALVQLSGITATASLDAQIVIMVELTSSLDALIFKAGISVASSLDAIIQAQAGVWSPEGGVSGSWSLETAISGGWVPEAGL